MVSHSQTHYCMFKLLFSHQVMSNSFMTPWTVAHQASLSMGFPRQEYWSGLPFPSPKFKLREANVWRNMKSTFYIQITWSKLGSVNWDVLLFNDAL